MLASSALLFIAGYINCGHTGFSTLELESSGLPSADLPSAELPDHVSKEPDFVLKCLPKNSSKLGSSPTTTIKDHFNGKWAPDLALSTSNKISNQTVATRLSEGLLLEVDNGCLQKQTEPSEIGKILKKKGLNRFLKTSYYKLNSEIQNMSFGDLQNLINSDSCLLHADKNVKFSLSQTNDPLLGEQSHLTNANFNGAFDRFYNPANGINRDVRIAIIDSGMDTSHPDLAANVLKNPDGKVIGYNPIEDNTTNLSDSGYHGTHVAGIAAAVANNAIGVTGVMGLHAKLIPIKVSPDGSNVDLDAVNNGILWATDHGAEVINMSFDSTSAEADRPSFRSAIEYALGKGVVFAVAAGNESAQILDTNSYYPAKYSALYKGVLAVGSIDASSDTRSRFSNYSPQYVKIMAPGSDGTNGILSTVPTSLSSSGYARRWTNSNGTYAIQGTSMSTPAVAGAAALTVGLAKSRGYNPSSEQIESLILLGSNKMASLSLYAKDGNKLDLTRLINAIDMDTNLDSNSNTDRSAAHGTISLATSPVGQSRLFNQPITLSATLTPESSILVNYQWYRNGVILPGETKNTLVIASASADDAGVYQLEIRAGSTVLLTQKTIVQLAPEMCP
jgi:subtilisin family serine protease